VAEHGLSTAEREALRGASQPELSEYLDALERAADEAAACVGAYEDAYFTVAGYAVRLRFAGTALMPLLLPALAHLRCDPVDVPALTVRLFDSESTGVEPPAAPWPDEAYARAGKVRAVLGGQLNGVFDNGRCSVYRPQRDQGLYWIRDARDIHYSETGSPLQPILHLWLATRGLQFAHASAVGDADGSVMIVGSGGVGKSTTALSCLPYERLRLIGDDYCLLAGGASPLLHTVYSSAKADAASLERLPFLRPMVTNPDRPTGDKALCMLNDHVPKRLLDSAPLKAVVVPRITARPCTTATPASAAAALTALAPSTLMQLPGAAREGLARLAAAVRSVPCYQLEVGSDPHGVPPVIERVLRA
jgi:hypothetical protein